MPESLPEAKAACIPHVPGGNRPLEGALYMIAACAFMATLSALGRHLSQSGVEPMQILFCRLAFAWMCMVPWLMMRGIGSLGTSQIRFYILRAFLSMGTMTAFFYALALIPIAEVTALTFLAPMFTTVGAALLLGEVVRLRRWAATIIGFCDALIIIRPGIVEMSLGSWYALGAAVFMGAAALVIKKLTRGDDPWTVVFFSHIIMIPMALVPAALVWTWPPPEIWLFLLATGPVAVTCQLLMTKAFSVTDVSLVAAVDFFRLPFAVLIGWMAFGELTDIWTWAGALVIFCSSFYIVRREQALHSQSPAAGSVAARDRRDSR